MEQISNIRALIALWPSRKAFADAIGVPLDRVHKWVTADAIPAKHHLAVLRSASLHGFPVSAEMLVRLHAEIATPDAEPAATSRAACGDAAVASGAPCGGTLA